MLKLTYTDNSFYLECLTQSLEEWVAQRVILALRVSQSLRVAPTTASFLLPLNLPGVERLKTEVNRHDSEIMGLCKCDAEYLEPTFRTPTVTGVELHRQEIKLRIKNNILSRKYIGKKEKHQKWHQNPLSIRSNKNEHHPEGEKDK